MRRLVVALLLALAFVALATGAALANGGPHGNYDKMTDGTTGLTDACAACHRVHEAVSTEYLLKKQTVYETCVSCHDGEGSRLDVLDGVKLAAVASVRPTDTVVISGTLNGGGFEYVNGSPTTSNHPLERFLGDTQVSNTPWGYQGDTGSQLVSITNDLSCNSCHNPHGSDNYRIIRNSINGITVSVMSYYNGGFTADEGERGLQPAAPADKYTKDYYGSAGLDPNGSAAPGGFNPDGTLVPSAGNPSINGFALVCGACHTSYPSADGGGDLPITAQGITQTLTINHNRHKTEVVYTDYSNPDTQQPVNCDPSGTATQTFNPATHTCDGTMPKLRLASDGTNNNKIVTCVTCHRAHGTATTMGGFALSKAFNGASPDPISPAQENGTDMSSTLLYLNNRGVCEACHQW